MDQLRGFVWDRGTVWDPCRLPAIHQGYSLHSPRPCWATAVSRVALCTCGLFCRLLAPTETGDLSAFGRCKPVVLNHQGMVLSPIFDVAVALEKMGGMRLLASPDTEVFSCQSPW